MENLNLTPAMEDYLEAIFLLEKENKVARVSDIGRHLNVRKASVVSAVANLGKLELLSHEKYGYIVMTEKGRQIGEAIFRKHTAILDFLTNVLKIDEEKAKKEACMIEHALSEGTVDRLVSFARQMKKDEDKNEKKQKKPRRVKRKKTVIKTSKKSRKK